MCGALKVCELLSETFDDEKVEGLGGGRKV